VLTVGICTLNRAASLRRTLVSLAECVVPTGVELEIVVADNGSTDDTPDVIKEFETSLPVRRIAEPRQGLSHARNAVVGAARGGYLLWTDDDCVVDRRWLAAYAGAIDRWPDAAVLGGPIRPEFEGETPPWLTRVAARVKTAYAARDLGREPLDLDVNANRVPFGANYGLRLHEQRAHLYDPRLGRGGALPVSVGEETEVMRAILREGGSGRWVPDAIVTHCIPSDRQTTAYLRDYFFAGGAYEEWRLRGADGVSRVELRRRAILGTIQYCVRRHLTAPEVWIEDLIAANVARGRMAARRALE